MFWILPNFQAILFSCFLFPVLCSVDWLLFSKFSVSCFPSFQFAMATVFKVSCFLFPKFPVYWQLFSKFPVSCFPSFQFTGYCFQSLLFPVSKVASLPWLLFEKVSMVPFFFHFPAFSKLIWCMDCITLRLSTTYYSDELDGKLRRRRMARFNAISKSIVEVHFSVKFDGQKIQNNRKIRISLSLFQKMLNAVSRIGVLLEILIVFLQFEERHTE